MKMLKLKTMICAVSLALLGTSGAWAQSTVPGDDYWSNGNAAPQNLSREQISSQQVAGWSAQSDVDDVRLQTIQVAAASLGSQAGLSSRSAEIQAALLVRAEQYDRAFDFSRLMLEPGFLPPVITEARDAYNQPNDSEARASDRVFRIERGARIVSANPTWRTYLLVPALPAVRPDTSVLPQNAEERRAWDQWAARGWEEGARLADQNFEANLARLEQDFVGMLRFKMLYEQGFVTLPRLSRADLGSTGGGDEMAVNDRIIRITERAILDANQHNWSRPVPQTAPQDR